MVNSFEHFCDAFVHQATTRPNKLALVVRHAKATLSLTWADLAQHVGQRVGDLNDLFKSDPKLPRIVGYSSSNSLDDLITALACPFAEFIEAPFDHQTHNPKETFDRVLGGHWIAKQDFSSPTKTISVVGTLDQLSRLCPINVDSAALILWTSGTTSDPKGVTLTHRNLCGNAVAKLAAVPQSPDDVRLAALPLCHAYARTCDFGTWLLSGCTLAVGIGFDGWQTLGPVVQPTLANTAPSLAARLMAADPNSIGIGRLRLLGCGGAAMSNTDFNKWADRNVTVIQGYGLTEASPVVCSATPDNATAGLVGDFVDGWEYEIRDGRLFVRGKHVMQGYWNDPHETASRIDQDGWLDTRDAVERDDVTGQIRILGRFDDVIVLDNGHKVHPQAIEKQIARISGVRHAMLVADGRHLSVWLDAEPIDDILSELGKQLSDFPDWERPRTIRYFEQPLTSEGGELTSKGTIRRSVLKQRIRSSFS